MEPEKIGRYEIKGVLGQGAMGLVYKAFDPRLERFAAIKVMNTGGEIDEELVTRFFHEARSAARLNHPNIIAVYDLEEGTESEDPFIAMEYLEGNDLKGLLKSDDPLSFEQRIQFAGQVCEALDYAHQNGIVHRDIKPGNIFVTSDGTPKLVDFGLARLASSEVTKSGVMLGSPYYMSPEQVKGAKDIDGRADLFAVGVVLYEMITARKPFEGDSPTSVCFQIVGAPHTPILDIFPGCAPDLARIVDLALSKERQERYQSGAEMAEDLRLFQAQLPRMQETLKRSIDTYRRRLQYLAERGFAPKQEVNAILAASNTTVDDYGALLPVHADLKARAQELDKAGSTTRQAAVKPPPAQAGQAASSESSAVERTQDLRLDAAALDAAQAAEDGTVVADAPDLGLPPSAAEPELEARPRPARAPARARAPGWLLPAAVVAVLAVVAGLWWSGLVSLTGQSPLVLNVAPWARVDSISHAGSGQAVAIESGLTTPCVVSLPPGRYRIQVSNPHFGQPLEFEAEVGQGSSVVQQRLPDFDAEAEIEAALEMR